MTDPAAIAELLPELRCFADRPTDAELAALPACAAVYLLQSADQSPVLLAHTQNLRRLAQSRFAEPDAEAGPQRRADLAEIVRRIRWREVDSRFEADWRYWLCTRRLYPHESDKLAPFGPAHYLRLNLADPVPHPEVSDRVAKAGGAFIGPFATRGGAAAAHEGLVDLFDLCRYPEQVRKAPQGQRCAYAEMGRCDAPCDGSADRSAYVERVRAAWRFAAGGEREWIIDAEARMAQLARELKFEAAALLKSQLEFARRWTRNHPRARVVEGRALVLLIPVARRRAWKPFHFCDGVLLDGPRIADRTLATELGAWLAGIDAQHARLRDELDVETRNRQHWFMAGFLHHPRCEEAVVAELDRAAEAPPLAQRLAAAALARRTARRSAPGA